jgi:NADPH-dependent glutamate synthase beta subunit-like oxidoreductase
MKKSIEPTAVCEFSVMRRPLTLQEAICEAERCLLCEDAPCSKGCPAGTDPGRFIRQIKFRNFKGAARTIRNNNILGSTCAHICPTDKTCARACSAKGLTTPIDIAGLQRFAIAWGRENGLEPLEGPAVEGPAVAVIGAGPAGLACAAELARLGHPVTVFEKDPVPGGVPRWNIPDFRLPVDEVAADCAQLVDLGVELRCGDAVDTADKVNEIINKYAAVVVATGLNEAFALPLFDGASNAMDYIAWLRRAKTDRERFAAEVAGKRVAIIGGGSVAMDAAVTARALGASRVTLVALEHLGELPADLEEIELGHLMDIVFRDGAMVTGVEKYEGGHIVALTGTEIEWIEPGRFVPANARPVPHSTFQLPVDFVVLAIGTRPVLAPLFDALPTWDKKCFAPAGEDRPWSAAGKLFAVGDVVNRGTMAVQAVGEGKKTAQAVHAFIAGGVK